MEQIANLRKVHSGPWINGVHLSSVFVHRRIQPLQNRAHPMWEYTGPKDVTRTKADDLSRDEFDTRIHAIVNIPADETPTLASSPFSSENPPKIVSVKNFFSLSFIRVKSPDFFSISDRTRISRFVTLLSLMVG